MTGTDAEGQTAPLVVTVSASYGSGGSVIAPLLAERLKVPWLDRLVSSTTAEQAGRSADPVGEGLSDREEEAAPGSRLFLYLARAAGANAMAPPESLVDHNELLRERAEAEIAQLCAGGGVLLGRAGAVVLRRRPATYHIRLDGPPKRRLARAALIEGITTDEAKVRMDDTDRARTLYVRRLYRVDPTDTSLYHLVLDPTVLSIDGAIDVLVQAVVSYRAAAADLPGRR
ncbi:cytidylate kinase-like family protein [Acidiferrimicrobium sp. IK]|uniref:cytidylate kinase-like family protein n=1 Tax=Acidiferrimicrobium sp. IK TaxID=2871700 RepID=UPI0021CAE9E0|nr:cytidylate kinase-like family protein [Acidiferrimicrobium sp. IK]MCU4187324.1 cytidylate kinase-like family protein [Acidiferrimicrobium sp. IK]